MDGGERRNSQYGTPYQTPGPGRPAPGQPMGPPTHDRYTQAAQSPARSDMPRPSVARPYMPGYAPFGYQEQQYSAAQIHSGSPIQGVDMSYNPTYVQDPTRPQQMQQSPTQQQYSAYGPGSMLPPMGQPIYESIPNYQQQRHAAAVEAMTSHFAPPSYMPHGDQAAVNYGGQNTQYISTQPEQSPYEPISNNRPQLQSAFVSATPEYSTLEHTESQEQQEEENNQEDLEEGMRQYETQLKSTFDAIAAGKVTAASETLMVSSRWFLSSIRALGFHHDDQTKHDQRIATWREFNHAWESLGQRQKDITEAALRTRRSPVDVLSATQITNLINELVRLCDQVEALGLVDYEMGVWEEQIVSVFTQCLDLLAPQGRTMGTTQRQ